MAYGYGFSDPGHPEPLTEKERKQAAVDREWRSVFADTFGAHPLKDKERFQECVVKVLGRASRSKRSERLRQLVKAGELGALCRAAERLYRSVQVEDLYESERENLISEMIRQAIEADPSILQRAGVEPRWWQTDDPDGG